jgi:hypothetical protein
MRWNSPSVLSFIFVQSVLIKREKCEAHFSSTITFRETLAKTSSLSVRKQNVCNERGPHLHLDDARHPLMFSFVGS